MISSSDLSSFSLKASYSPEQSLISTDCASEGERMQHQENGGTWEANGKLVYRRTVFSSVYSMQSTVGSERWVTERLRYSWSLSQFPNPRARAEVEDDRLSFSIPDLL